MLGNKWPILDQGCVTDTTITETADETVCEEKHVKRSETKNRTCVLRLTRSRKRERKSCLSAKRNLHVCPSNRETKLKKRDSWASRRETCSICLWFMWWESELCPWFCSVSLWFRDYFYSVQEMPSTPVLSRSVCNFRPSSYFLAFIFLSQYLSFCLPTIGFIKTSRAVVLCHDSISFM